MSRHISTSLNTVLLQRIDRRSIESKAMLLSITAWLLIWLGVGIAAKAVWNDWYGFGAGFVLGPVISVFLIWMLYARPAAREKKVVRGSYAESTLRIFDPIDQKWEGIDLSLPHKALLVEAKAEGLFLLRLEQGEDDTKTRIDIIGDLPPFLPMPINGSAHSLWGFIHMGGKEALRATPYRIKETPSRDQITARLLKFIDEHRQTRTNNITIKRGDDIISIDNGQFTLITPNKRVSFSEPADLAMAVHVRPATHSKGDLTGHAVGADELQIAIYPKHAPADALVFGMLVPASWTEANMAQWRIPQSAMRRKFTLYDDSITTFVVTRILARYVRAIAPNAKVLTLLRA